MGFFKKFSETGFSVFEKLRDISGVNTRIKQKIAENIKKDLNTKLNHFLKLTRHRIILCVLFLAFNISTLYLFKNKLLILIALTFSFLFLIYLIWNILNLGKTILKFLSGNIKEKINQEVGKNVEDQLKDRSIASLFVNRDHYNVVCGEFLQSLNFWLETNKKRLSYTLLLYAIFMPFFLGVFLTWFILFLEKNQSLFLDTNPV